MPEVEIKEEDDIKNEDDEEIKDQEKEEPEVTQNMPSIFNSNSTLHLLEAMIMSAGSKYLLKMYNKFFKVYSSLICWFDQSINFSI